MSKTMSHLFSETPYLSIGDPYKGSKGSKRKDPAADDPKKWDRHKGKQFTTNPMKQGRPVRHFKSLYEKEKFYDPGYHQRNYAKEQKKKILAGSFKPSSPSKKNSGVGAYFGTIGTKYEHKAEYNVVKRGDKPKKIEQTLKNITTNPSKKGGYGFTNLGISKDYQRGQFVDDYEAGRKKLMKEREEKKKKQMGGPFKAGRSSKNNYFDSNPYGVTNLVKETKKKKYQEPKKVPVPFKPSSPAKRQTTIGKYPSYMSDPYIKPKEKKKNDEPKAVWKTARGNHSGPTRSILFK